MDIRMEHKADFFVQGYAVETRLSACEDEVGGLWAKWEAALRAMAETSAPLYGVMWYTEDNQYVYLLGIQGEGQPQNGMTAVKISAAEFAVASVPENMTEIEAWTAFFEMELPLRGYLPDAEHEKYFELHKAAGACELWTPIKHMQK